MGSQDRDEPAPQGGPVARGARSVVAFFDGVNRMVAAVAAVIALALAIWGGSQLDLQGSKPTAQASAACSDGRDNDRDGKIDF
ncbi:MAG: hypothetical protein QOD69_414, partial [Solirubrobacteraceae bacterium]|nr:hypothetical protein [Solirubrobacteraceae bacterium]